MTSVCVVGSGAREHALAVALARTASVTVTPGNPGITALHPFVACTPARSTEIDADLFVIGPEVPLVDGLADRLRRQGKLVFGPGAHGAHVEGSKAWMKDLLVSARVPTAAHGTFEHEGPAVAFLRQLSGPYVVKTDGLAAGKGVLVTWSRDEAIDDVRAKLSGTSFGPAGRTVVIEEGLVGDELSVMAICDGHSALPLAAAQDFKRVGEGDSGPNTGGMGSFSPVPGAGDDLVDIVMDTAVLPTLAALRARGIDYRGVLYAGIMLTAEGPKVLEFNVRFGDPETQVLVPRWQGDVTAVLAAAASGSLGSSELAAPSFSHQSAVCVVLAADGYPAAPRTGDVITGLDVAAGMEGVQLFAAAVEGAGAGLATSGGRVLSVSAVSDTLTEARARAYAAAAVVDWPGRQYRRDIAGRAADGYEVGGARPDACSASQHPRCIGPSSAVGSGS